MLAERIFNVIASALDDGHGTPEDEQEATVAVVNALHEAGFVIVVERNLFDAWACQWAEANNVRLPAMEELE